MFHCSPIASALAALAIALAANAPAHAQERQQVPAFRTYGEPAPGEVEQLRALFDAFKAAWGAGDADALMALHAEDVEWINAFARMFQGKPALSAFIRERLFPQFGPEVARQEAEAMTLISVRYLGDDAAVLHFYLDSPRGPSRIEGQTLRRTHIHLVAARGAEGWRVVHEVIMDAR